MPMRSWADLLQDAGDAGKTFELLPDGPYDFIVEESKAGQSGSGLQRFSITAKVESGPSAGRKIFHDFYVTPDKPAGLGFFFRNMAVLGLNDQFFAANPSEEQIAAALKGRRFIGIVGNEEWPKDSGKKKNRINTFQTPRGAAPGPGAAGPASVGPGIGGPAAPLSPPAAPLAAPPAAPVAAVAPQPVPAPAAVPTPAPVTQQPEPAIIAAAPAPVQPPVAPAPAEQVVVPPPAQPIDPWANAAGSPGPAAGAQNYPAPPPFE